MSSGLKFFKHAFAAIQWGQSLALCSKLPQVPCIEWANCKGSGETAWMLRLAWAFAVRICDKYHFHVSWLISIWTVTWQKQQNDCAPREDSDQPAAAQSDQSSLSAWRDLGPLATHWAHSQNSDQTGWMPRLIWVFAGGSLILLVLSWGGSFFSIFLRSFCCPTSCR